MNIKDNSANPPNPMIRAGHLISAGAMMLFVLPMLYFMQTVLGWNLHIIFIGYFNLFLIIFPIGWILIGLGYRQFNYQIKTVKTKINQQNLTHRTKKSGTILIVLAIISLPFTLAFGSIYLIFLLTLISILVQFIIGFRLRMWNAPDVSIPAEVMIPGR
ncbi:MAG: hypothetical protein Q6364_06340 [Candidatus Hermodarchaeota archaeon]|nr:hypothetical protein [Candidatus Hermodarchaeota archaeon]